MVAVFILLLLQQFRNLTIVCLANEMQDMLNTTKEAHLGEQVVLKKAAIAHELAKLAIDLMNSSSGVGGAPAPPPERPPTPTASPTLEEPARKGPMHPSTRMLTFLSATSQRTLR